MCVDNDECATTSGLCGAHSVSCTNTPGSYTCACDPGYAAPASGGTCTDVDECALGTDDCDHASGAICTNVSGTFICTCPAGVGGSGHGTASCSGPRFTDLGTDVIRDNNGSGLAWQKVYSTVRHTQTGAIAYCASLTLDGGGWRLPTYDEFHSIVDTRFNPKIDPTYFPGAHNSSFWTSTSNAGPPPTGCTVYFIGSDSCSVDPINALFSHCVR